MQLFHILAYLCVTTVFIMFVIIILQVKYIHSLCLIFIYFNSTLNYIVHGTGEMTQIKSTCCIIRRY